MATSAPALAEATRIENERLDRIRVALNNKKLVVVIGAGVTISATSTVLGESLARISWRGLIRHGLDYLVTDGHVEGNNRRLKRACEILDQSNPDLDDLLDAAGILKSLLDKTRQLPTWLQAVFDGLSKEVRHPAVLDVLKSFHEKGAMLLTTNYDDLFEEGYCNLRRINQSNHEEILKFQSGDLRGILHIHGSYHTPNDVILDATDYYEVRHSDDIQGMLRTLWNTYTMMFVGCGSGLEDPNFSALLKWACEHQSDIPNRHCLLVRTGDSLSHQPLVRLQFGPSYSDLVPYLQRLLEDPVQPAAGSDGQSHRESTSESRNPRNRMLIAEMPSEKELDRLPIAAEALFNSFQKQHESTCLPNTRVDVLKEIFNWAGGQDERSIFWLNGLAGTGKSTIAHTVARTYLENGRLGASFFFSRGGGDVGHAVKFVTSIAVQLARNVPNLCRHICGAIAERNDIANQSLRDQWQHLIVSPLLKLDDKDSRSSYVLVVDALDECADENNIRTILQLLAKTRSVTKIRIRIFLTSRPEIPIRYGLCQMPDTEHKDFVLHNISRSTINHDITVFLESKLSLIGQERSFGAGWPGEDAITHLVQSASGLFIWAATACRYIHEGGSLAADRLSIILQGSLIEDPLSTDDSETDISSIDDSAVAPNEQLNKIYLTVLRSSVGNLRKKERKKWYKLLKDTAGSIVLLLSPLSILSLARLLKVSPEQVIRTLGDLHSILDIPDDLIRPLRLHHPSFRDFLLDQKRCNDLNFWVNEKQAQGILAARCIELMSTSLKQDICGMKAPGVLVADISSNRVEQYFTPEVQYACLCWVQHLQKSDTRLHDNDLVHQFLQMHLLHWLEALSWMRRISEGIYAITSLESVALEHDCPRLSEFIQDAKRFALFNQPVLEYAPLQVYCSALIFTPTISIVRRQFKDRIPRWMQRLPKVENDWSALLQTFEGHGGPVEAVAFSPDGKVVASASSDSTVKLWDAGSGAALQTLEGHGGPVRAVTFSPDGKVVASASSDRTVKLWDAGSGAALQTLEGHGGWVRAVAFSPDGKVVASASSDSTVKLWDAGSGTALQTLEGHGGWVWAVAFSPDGKVVASASGDSTVKLWDAGSGTALQTLEGHGGPVWAVAFSPDGKVVASASDDRTVKLWDAGSGAALQTLEGHGDSVWAVAFSPDGKVVASASDDSTVKLWDAGSGAALQTLEGHGAPVEAVAFSPDGKVVASASDDSTVKLWDAGSGTALQTFPVDAVIQTLSFSNDGTSLWTERGQLHDAILSHGLAVSESIRSWDIFVKQQWISWGMNNMLWLPSEYRQCCVDIHSNVVAFGFRSGRVTVMAFDFESY